MPFFPPSGCIQPDGGREGALLIMAGLYAIGLVVDGPKGAAVWSKIKSGTLYESGYSIEEIRVALLRHSSKSIGKDK